MKIIINEGCTTFSTLIDDKHIEDISKEEMEEVVDYLLVRLKEGLNENTISFDSLVGLFQYDDYECSKENCEQCGDSWSSTTWII